LSAKAILFVHGAFHGSWCWDAVVAGLTTHGIPCRSIELYRGGLAADVAAIRAEIDALAAEGHSVVVVGHSLGCASLSSLTPERIAHAVFLAGPIVGPGLPPIAECTTPDFTAALTISENRSMEVDLELARDLFYHDCSAAQVKDAIPRLRPNQNYGPKPPEGTPLYERVPSTYLWCDDDRVVHPKYQRQLAEHTRYSEGFATSHSPMLSAPDELVAALLRVLERTE